MGAPVTPGGRITPNRRREFALEGTLMELVAGGAIIAAAESRYVVRLSTAAKSAAEELIGLPVTMVGWKYKLSGIIVVTRIEKRKQQ